MKHFLSHSNFLRHWPSVQTPAWSPLCPPAKATLNLGITKRKCKLWGCQVLNPTWRANTINKMVQETVLEVPGLSKCQEARLCANGALSMATQCSTLECCVWFYWQNLNKMNWVWFRNEPWWLEIMIYCERLMNLHPLSFLKETYVLAWSQSTQTMAGKRLWVGKYSSF